MCGICGIVNISEFRQPESVRLRANAMLQALSHRGPDDVGLVSSDSAVLGATRLAIRGGDDGRQPMVDAASGVVAVCNGEIDNHQELRHWLAERGRPVKQATDVAVIPGMYLELGAAFAEKLVGAFAIGIWDPRERRLTLIRDRAGERPLFFTQNHGRQRFSPRKSPSIVSEGKLPVTFDKTALAALSAVRIVLLRQPRRSPTSKKFRPAASSRLIAAASGIRLTGAGKMSRRRNKNRRSMTFDNIFRESVRRQSDVDVDFAVFLSGGVDSSLVSAVTRSLHPDRPLKAYTLRFEEESFDEGNFAESVATSLKLEPVTVWVRPEDLPKPCHR